MRHFIAYHNTEKMGRSLGEGQPLRLLTSKPVKPLLGNVVWFITGEGSKGRDYSLGSVFRVEDAGEAPEGGFKHYAGGPGHVFTPPIPVDDESWLPEVLRATGRFAFGVSEIRDAAAITALCEIAKKSSL